MTPASQSFREWLVGEIEAVLGRNTSPPPFLIWCDPDEEWLDEPITTWKGLTPGSAKGTLVDDQRVLQVLAGSDGEFSRLKKEWRISATARLLALLLLVGGGGVGCATPGPSPSEAFYAGQPLRALEIFCRGALEHDKDYALNRNQVLICGIETHVCIHQTTIDLVKPDELTTFLSTLCTTTVGRLSYAVLATILSRYSVGSFLPKNFIAIKSYSFSRFSFSCSGVVPLGFTLQ